MVIRCKLRPVSFIVEYQMVCGIRTRQYFLIVSVLRRTKIPAITTSNGGDFSFHCYVFLSEFAQAIICFGHIDIQEAGYE